MVLVDVFKSEPDVQKLKANGDMRGLVKAMYYKGDSSVRMAAVLAIKEIGGATAIDHLADALENDDTRWLAASALERIGQPAEKALKEVTNGKNIYAQKMAQRILDKIGYRPDTVLSAATSQTDF
jgi:hypothetical protein